MRRGMIEAPAETAQAIRARKPLVDALHDVADGRGSADTLDAALDEFRRTSSDTGEGDVIWAFSQLTESAARAVRWKEAVWDAEVDAERHATAARVRATDVVRRARPSWPAGLADAAQKLEALDDPERVTDVAASLSRVPLPPRVTDLFRKAHDQPREEVAAAETERRPAVALLVRMQGEPVMRPTVVRPRTMHQLQVEARVSEWPEGADTLEVTFLTVHPREILYATDLTFTPAALVQPLEILVGAERPPTDPPLELTAQATFLGGGERVAARLAGNTTLELVTFDPGTDSAPDTPAALRLLQMMGELRNAIPHLDIKDQRDVKLLLDGLLRFSRRLHDDRPADLDMADESWFQRELRAFLQADPQIGTRLVERAGRAGGSTDLMLGNIVLELKVEKTRTMTVTHVAARFASQPTQYASAGDSQVSLLAVLDVTPKRAPAGVMGNEMEWTYTEVASGPEPRFPSMVGLVIVRVGYPLPSEFSRRSDLSQGG